MSSKPDTAVTPQQNVTEVSPSSVLKINSTGGLSTISTQCSIRIAVAAGSVLLFIAVYLLRLDHVVGLYIDEAWYVLLAKSLATGQGYSLINSPTPFLPPLYPPGFPLLLSLAWRLSPQFPQNLWLLKSVSILAMLGVGIAAYRYFYNYRGMTRSLALGITLATVLSPLMVYLCTSMVMSDTVFLLGAFLTVISIERCVSKVREGKALRYAILAALCVSYTYLTRSVAIGLIAAVGIYLLKKRLIRPALIFAFGVVLLIAPWMFYSGSHAASQDQLKEQNGYIIQNYKTQFWQHTGSQVYYGFVTASEIPKRVWGNIKFIMTFCTRRMMVTGWMYHQEFLQENVLLFLPSLILSGIVMLGFMTIAWRRITLVEIYTPIALAIILIWPFHEVRYILTLMPFLVFYFVIGLQRLTIFSLSRLRISVLPQSVTIMQIAVWGLVALHLYHNTEYILQFHGLAGDSPRWVRHFEESQKIFDWINQNIPKDQVVATDNQPMLHLITGHKTVSADELISISFEPASSREYWNRLGVRYAAGAWAQYYFLQDTPHRLIYQPRGELFLRVVEVLPSAAPSSVGFKKPPEE
jgi:hypothetical protein